MKDRSEALKTLRVFSEQDVPKTKSINTLSRILNRVDLELATKEGELDQLVRSQEAAESKN